jgi:hypothetical protein
MAHLFKRDKLLSKNIKFKYDNINQKKNVHAAEDAQHLNYTINS